MRTLLLANLALIPACLIGTGDIVGDDKTPGVCGDGVINTGETCDDGNTASGDGCSATCQTESTSTPRIDGSVDQPTLMTELGKTETVQLSIKSVNGFAGTVNIAAALTDTATSASIPGVMVTVAPSADVSADATVMVPLTIKIPSDTTGTAIMGSLKIDLTNTTVAAANVTSSVAIDHIYTVTYIDGTGATQANHYMAGQAVTVLRGTIIRFKNADTTVVQHVIHGDGPFPHEDPRDAVTTQTLGMTYDVPTLQIAPGAAGSLGCHTHGAASYIGFTVM